ncbi:WD repeat and coiled-coil-containing protein [Holothuria leucospilota]|uniref:WD repeat and coiled-coil-containing protein n=1 Tax=Holothuria leucospilota TaxID=206669 RepID=A0A9Q0YT93_HOLLE|nr:WD repeat and coiled-coil-containing protein [Holothuria leucospilota]
MASVPLGRGGIQVRSCNLLMNCYHPNHGWLWTDGQSVFLLPCQNDGVVEDASECSRKLGDYVKVIQLSWSSALDDQSQCFLAVQEPQSVTIWEVAGRNPNQQFTLKMKLEGMKQISGVIWHPLLPLVCILSSSGTSVFSLNPDWSVSLSSTHHTIGCWTPDGHTLVLANDRVLRVCAHLFSSFM